MGIFSADEIVTNASTSETTLIAVTLVVIVLMMIIFVCARMYAKFLKSSVNESARREVQLANIKHT